MNRKFFVLQLRGDTYTISHNKSKNILNSKMTNEVQQLTSYSWSCTNKKNLLEFAKQHKEKTINALKEKLEKAENRQILCDGV